MTKCVCVNGSDFRLFSVAILVLAALLLYRLLTWKFRQDENSISLWDDVIWQGYHPSHIIIPCSLCSRRDQTQYSVSQSIRMAYEIIHVFPEGTRNLTEHVMLLWKHAWKDVTVSLSSLICGRRRDTGDRFASSPSVARCQLGCCLTSTGY